MTVESVTYIDDLNASNPAGTDAKSEGDDHIRNLKTGIKNSFPNIDGAMTSTQAELNNLDGYTGNTADLNILSGADAAGLTAAELQYVKGATSDIQTQLDEKETYIQSVTGTVAASALTLGLGAGSLNFRNATLTNGVATSNTNIALSLVVPSGATLGTSDAVESDLILLAIDNAGTSELAVVNNSGTVSLDEKALISTTAIGVGSDSADAAYSTTARSDVAFRVVGLIRSTQATAGTWATSPNLLQGRGGTALISPSLGNLAALDTVTSTEIDADAVGKSEIASDSVGGDELVLTSSTDSSTAISGSSSSLIPAGMYFCFESTGDVTQEVKINTQWRAALMGTLIWSDGTNMRWKNVNVSAQTVYWRRLD